MNDIDVLSTMHLDAQESARLRYKAVPALSSVLLEIPDGR